MTYKEALALLALAGMKVKVVRSGDGSGTVAFDVYADRYMMKATDKVRTDWCVYAMPHYMSRVAAERAIITWVLGGMVENC